MNRTELVKAVAESSGVDSTDVDSVLKSFQSVVSDGVAKGDKITIQGFLTFEQVDRAAREGRNPATGEAMTLAASRKLAFSPAKAVKAALNA